MAWELRDQESITESYVNLIPTIQGGTHVAGMRTGITDALKEFCEYRNLIPKGVKVTAEDVWKNASYVLSAKLKDPQFSGQTKEKLSSKDFKLLQRILQEMLLPFGSTRKQSLLRESLILQSITHKKELRKANLSREKSYQRSNSSRKAF